MMKKRLFFPLFIFAFLFLAFTGCKSGNEKSKVFKPNFSGEAGEILVVVEKKIWDDTLGKAMKYIFQQEIYGLPQPEPMFTLMNINPEGFEKLYQTHRNIIIVRIADKYQKPALKLQEDVWAHPQKVMNVAGSADTAVIRKLMDQQEKMRSLFRSADRNRLIDYFRKNEKQKIRNQLIKEHHVSLTVPVGYNIDKSEKDFIWIAHETTNMSQGIFVYHYPYEDPSTFTKSYLLDKRNEYLKKYVPGPTQGSYMTTENRFIDPRFEEIVYKERYFARMRGLWRVENDFMGGPFISLTTLDKARNRVVTVEGYVYAPQFDKRKYIRQLEAILYTLKIPGDKRGDAKIAE